MFKKFTCSHKGAVKIQDEPATKYYCKHCDSTITCKHSTKIGTSVLVVINILMFMLLIALSPVVSSQW